MNSCHKYPSEVTNERELPGQHHSTHVVNYTILIIMGVCAITP